jgi:hypothetical protein
MTQAFNLSQLANNLTSSGLLDAADGLVNAVPVVNGGTGATTASAARTNLGLIIGTNVPSPTGGGASGTWGINITGNAATATTAANGGVTGISAGDGISISASTGNVTITNTYNSPYNGQNGQLFTSSGIFTVPTGVTKLHVIVAGGGGASGAQPLGDSSANGGFGGYAEGYITVSSGASYAVTVGAGAGWTAGNGGSGGTSSFGSLISATGGAGGAFGGSYQATSGNGTGGTIANTNISVINNTLLRINKNAPGASGTPSAYVWDISSAYSPGACGTGSGDYARGMPSFGGIVFIEW